jgi:hypothetical protein
MIIQKDLIVKKLVPKLCEHRRALRDSKSEAPACPDSSGLDRGLVNASVSFAPWASANHTPPEANATFALATLSLFATFSY